MRLFETGIFQLHSGGRSMWRINCEVLTVDDWDTLAAIAAELIGPFGSVEFVPEGGRYFASALMEYKTEGPLLIVDDVLTTGASMEEQRAGRDAIGVVAFARCVPAAWITAVWATAQ